VFNRIGKYELTGVLGQGVSSTVYRALDSFSNAEVALKVFDAAVFRESEFGAALQSKFLSEASVAGKLNHPHIVSVLDAVVTDGSGHVAMEYLPRGNLSQYAVAGSLLSVEDAIQVGFKCCGALDYAFRAGIVHRDIKPENVMVVSETAVKMADFGADCLHKGKSPQTATIGTAAYMSPEQISEKPLTHQSDMFCLGVVLYELLTGQRPFLARDIPALIRKIMTEDPAPPSRLYPSLASEFDSVILTALSKNPMDRFPTWADFALELAKIGRLSIYQKTIPDSEKYRALRQVELLAKLNDAEIWELVQAGRWSRLPAQSLIIREGNPGQTLFFLAQGQLKVTKQGQLLNIIGAGEFFGEMTYIRDGEIPRQATVESLTDAVIAEFESAALKRMSDSCQHQLARALLRTLVDRLALANVRISHVIH